MTARALPRVAPADVLELTKPRIVGFVLMTVAAGYVLAGAAPTLSLGARTVLLLHTLLGTALVAGGACALNQVAERDVDARMRRTARRPLPSGRIGVGEAAAFGWLLGLTGIAYLAAIVGVVTAALAAATLVSYVFIYTPLKRRTTLATLVGAVPGALPILGGWTAGAAAIDARAWALFWILFLWQIPHFLALSWLYREDYARAGLRMLSLEDADGAGAFRQAVVGAAALVPVSLAPTALLLAGPWYFAGAVILSAGFLLVSVRALRSRTIADTRRLFAASLVYLPVLLALMVVDRIS